MLNYVTIIGRIVDDLKIDETETGTRHLKLMLAVPRNHKNMSGIYETDFIPCHLWKNIADNVKEYCVKGDLIALKGRIESTVTTDDGKNYDKNKKINLIVVAESVSFLSNKKEA